MTTPGRTNGSPGHAVNQRGSALRNVTAFYCDFDNMNRFPTLRGLALKYLGVPASESCCEKIFSAVKAVVGDVRHSLAPGSVESQTLLKINGWKLVQKKFI
jgi:hypothetical protein